MNSSRQLSAGPIAASNIATLGGATIGGRKAHHQVMTSAGAAAALLAVIVLAGCSSPPHYSAQVCGPNFPFNTSECVASSQSLIATPF